MAASTNLDDPFGNQNAMDFDDSDEEEEEGVDEEVRIIRSSYCF